MGGELRFSRLEIQKRLRRTSAPAPLRSGKEARRGVGLFKTPPVPIMVEGGSLSLRIDEFFGKAEGDTENYISKPDAIISFIISLGNDEMRGEAAKHLLNILPRFGEEEPFLEMTEVADVICRLNHGPPASLIFLDKIDSESETESKTNILVKLMSVFNSDPILDSFALFAKIGPRSISQAASQIVVLGLQLREADTIRKIGETITELNDNFGMYTTYGYRTTVFDIATKREISVESRVKLVDELSGKITTFEDDEEVIEFAQMVERAFLVEKEPEAKILELCKKK